MTQQQSVKAHAQARTTAAWNVAYLFRYAERRGLSSADLAARFDVDLAVLEDVDGRVPLSTLARLWEELPELVGDPDMPLHVVEHATSAELPLIALLFLASPCLADGFRQLERYQRVTHDLSDVPVSRWVREGALAHVVLDHERSAVSPPKGAVIDALLGMLLIARMATGQEITPVGITLRHPRPRNEPAYREAFRCPIDFDASHDRMTLRASDLALRHLDPSRTLLLIAAKHADALLASLPTTADTLSAARAELRLRLPHGELSLDDLAKPLGLSKRTLQRRLEQAGTSLRKLVDEERQRLALELMKNPRLSITDIALLLGFSDLSAFTRAFTRWTDRPPTQYRRERS